MTADDRAQREIDYHREVAAREIATMKPTDAAVVTRYREAKHWRTNRHECVIHWLIEGKPAHIADYGCGSGEMSVRLGLMGFQVTGFDVSPELVEAARHRAQLDGVADRVKFEVCGFMGEGIPDNAFDGVLAMSVLHHVPFPAGVEMLHRMLKPGGHVAILEPVAYSQKLQSIRDALPVEKDVSPDERQLGDADIACIARYLDIEKTRHFYLTQRLAKVLPPPRYPRLNEMLRHLDQWLLAIPGMDRLAGTVVLRARKKS